MVFYIYVRDYTEDIVRSLRNVSLDEQCVGFTDEIVDAESKESKHEVRFEFAEELSPESKRDLDETMKCRGYEFLRME